IREPAIVPARRCEPGDGSRTGARPRPSRRSDQIAWWNSEGGRRGVPSRIADARESVAAARRSGTGDPGAARKLGTSADEHDHGAERDVLDVERQRARSDLSCDAEG